MKQEELNKIIKEHDERLITNGNKGKTACLIGEDLHHMFYAMRFNEEFEQC